MISPSRTFTAVFNVAPWCCNFFFFSLVLVFLCLKNGLRLIRRTCLLRIAAWHCRISHSLGWLRKGVLGLTDIPRRAFLVGFVSCEARVSPGLIPFGLFWYGFGLFGICSLGREFYEGFGYVLFCAWIHGCCCGGAGMIHVYIPFIPYRYIRFAFFVFYFLFLLLLLLLCIRDGIWEMFCLDGIRYDVAVSCYYVLQPVVMPLHGVCCVCVCVMCPINVLINHCHPHPTPHH